MPTTPAQSTFAQYEPPSSQASPQASSQASSRTCHPCGHGDAWVGARILEVEPGSPADRAGLEPGITVTHVNDVELRDMIDWDWEADGPQAYLEGVALDEDGVPFEYGCDIERDCGEDWGVTFDGAVFDGMRLCRNDCIFCFMKMLPKGMRKSLYMRDDDYRLSFLQGNFVTLTNMSDADVERVVNHALSPLNVSLHAVSPDVRRTLMGKNAPRGIEVLRKLLDANIEVHAQIVLVPGVNDGEELVRTLCFVQENPSITSLGIVPLGFTRFQDTFSSSYDDPDLARSVIEAVRPFQERSRERDGITRFQLADEFYLNAGIEVPATQSYDDFPQYYDGIGMVRCFIDEASELGADPGAWSAMESFRSALDEAGRELVVVCGTGVEPIYGDFLEHTPLGPRSRALGVKNEFFGGNVNVTGLLTAEDVLRQLPDDLSREAVVVPEIMFNSDGLTLDGMSDTQVIREIERRGGRCRVVPTMPRTIVEALPDFQKVL